MIWLSLVFLAAPLPLYPGATTKDFGVANDPETRFFWVERTPQQVAAWYAKRLRITYRVEKSEEANTYTIPVKEHRLNMGGTTRIVLQRAVVVWGAKGGSSFFALIDRKDAPGPARSSNPGLSLEFGPDAKVEKPKGADPSRYGNDRLKGRSVEGRSVQGNFP